MISWGIIGAGDVAEYKSGPALRDVEGSELLAVMRRNAGAAQDFARRHHVDHWYVTVSDLLADERINAVYVASPHHLHLEHVAAAAGAGKRILCEKPMGSNLGEALEIVKVCEDGGVPLCVAYYRRFWPVTRALRDLIAGGAVGEVVSATISLADKFAGDPGRSWLTVARLSGGGALANTGSHWVDLARFLLGDVEAVSALNRVPPGAEVEHTSALLMRMTSGALVWCATSWESSTPTNEITITGTRGRIEVPSLVEGRVVLSRDRERASELAFPRHGAAHSELVQAIVAAWAANAGSPIPGEEAVATWRVMRAAYRSAEEGRLIAIE